VGYSLLIVLFVTIIVSLNVPITNINDGDDEDSDAPHSPMPERRGFVFFEEDIQEHVPMPALSLNTGKSHSPSLEHILTKEEFNIPRQHENEEESCGSDCSASIIPISQSAIPVYQVNDFASVGDIKYMDDKSYSRLNLILPSTANEHETNIHEIYHLRGTGRTISL